MKTRPIRRAERAILDATDAVEALAPDPLLTEAVTLLGQAREKVSAYVERQPNCQHKGGVYQLEAETYCRTCDALIRAATKSCPECHGTGRDDDAAPCNHCGGDGHA
jgi:uncharacterized paraquat-inducible protein A